MSKTLQLFASEMILYGADPEGTSFYVLGNGGNGANWYDGADAETHVNNDTWGFPYKVRKAGTYSNLAANLQCNASTVTLRSRKNGTDGAMTFTTGSDGIIADTTHSDSVAVGDDRVDVKATWSPSADQPNAYWIRENFEAATGHVTSYVSYWTGVVDDTAKLYSALLGGYNTNGLEFQWNEAAAQHKVRAAGTISNFQWNVSDNSCNNGATLKIRKNGSDTTAVITIPGDTTGWYEDNTHTVSVADGDLVTTSQQNANSTGTVGGAFHCVFTSSSLKTDHYWGTDYQADRNGTIGMQYSSAGRFVPLASDGMPRTVEANYAASMGFDGTLSRLRVYINSDPGTLNANATFRLRKNGTDATQVISNVPPNVSGWAEDTTHTDNFNPTDTLCIRFTGGSSGRISFITGITIEYRVGAVQLTANPIITGSPSFGTATLHQKHVLPNANAILTGSPSFGSAVLYEQIRKRINESMNLDEVKVRARTLVADLVAEQMSMLDAAKRLRARIKRKALGIDLNETRSKLRQRIKAAAATVQSADAYTLVKTVVRFFNETTEATAALLHFRGRRRLANESQTIDDLYARVSGFIRSADESVGITAALVRARARVWLRVEEFLIWEWTFPSIFRGSRIINEGLEAVEQYVRSRELLRLWADTLELAELIPTRTIGTILAVAEAVSIAWARNKFRLRVRRSAAAVEQAETWKKLRLRVRLRDAAVQLVDTTTQRVIGLFKYRNEQVRVDWTSPIARGFAQVWNDTLEASEGLLRYLWQVKLQPEEINPDDTVWVEGPGMAPSFLESTAVIARELTRLVHNRREFLWLEETKPYSMFALPAVVVSWVSIQAKRGWEIGVVRRISEIIETAGAALRYFGRIQLANEAVQLVDGFVHAMAKVRRKADALDLSETFGRMTGLVVRAIEELQIADALSYLRGKIRYTIELHNIAETRRRAISRLRLIADALNLDEARSRVRHLLRRFADALSLDEVRSHTKFRRKIRNETERAIEFLAHSFSLLRLSGEAVEQVEALTRAFYRLRVRIEFISTADANVRSRLRRRLRAEAEEIGEVFDYLSKLIRFSLASVEVAEVRQRLRVRLRKIAAGINVNETRVKLKSVFRWIAATINLDESRIGTRFILKQLAASVSISEVLHAPIKVIMVILDGMNVIEALATRRWLMRLPLEIMGVIEHLNLRRDYIRPINEALNDIERAIRVRGMFRIAANEVVSLVDAAIGHVGLLIKSLVMSAVRFRLAIDTLIRARPAVDAKMETEPLIETAETPSIEPSVQGNAKLRGP